MASKKEVTAKLGGDDAKYVQSRIAVLESEVADLSAQLERASGLRHEIAQRRKTIRTLSALAGIKVGKQAASRTLLRNRAPGPVGERVIKFLAKHPESTAPFILKSLKGTKPASVYHVLRSRPEITEADGEDGLKTFSLVA